MSIRQLSSIHLIQSGGILLPIFIAVIFLPGVVSAFAGDDVPVILARGDSFTMSGFDSGNGSPDAWIIGKNYFNHTPFSQNGVMKNSVILGPGDTILYSSGRYAILVQDPGRNGKSDVFGSVDPVGNITFQNPGKIIIDLGPAGHIPGNAEISVKNLVDQLVRSGVDDIFSARYFIVEEPVIHFDQITASNPHEQLPSVAEGSPVELTGTTNIGTENILHADLRRLDTNTLVASKNVPVIASTGHNRWSADFSTDGLPTGQYLVTIGWMKTDTTGTSSSIFTLVPSVADSNGTGISLAASDHPGDPIPAYVFFLVACALVAVGIVITVRKKK